MRGLGGGLARGSLPLTESAGITKHRSQIGIHAGTRLHSYELERAAHQSFRLSLVCDAYGNPAMISRYSASSSELKLRRIQRLLSRRSIASLLTSTRDSRDHATSLRYYFFFSRARIDTHQSTPTPMKNVPKPIQNRPTNRATEGSMSSSISL